MYISYAAKPIGSQPPLLDPKEQRRKRDRERYARVTDEEKQEKLKIRREAYHQRKKTSNDDTQIQKRKEHDRQRYANMKPEQKRAKIEQTNASRMLRCNTPSKDSIAMENPAYIEEEMPSQVIPSALTTKQRKHVAPGERHC